MTNAIPASALQLLSLVKDSGQLEISLVNIPVPEPREKEPMALARA